MTTRTLADPRADQDVHREEGITDLAVDRPAARQEDLDLDFSLPAAPPPARG